MAATAAAAMPHPLPHGERSRHTNSEVINRLDISDPQEDLAREQARLAESAGLHVVNTDDIANINRSPPSSAPRRQDFSNEKTSRRDQKIGDYNLGPTLGEGEFGKVKMGWKDKGDVQVAIKLIRREKLDTQQRLAKVYREINILRELDHPNIVKLHEMVETERTIGIILEYASGGELFDFILNERYLKDHDARRLFAQLVSGIGYLHKKGIIHRDLKLENLLLDRNKNIIITDFGFANTFDPKDELGEKIESRLHRRSFVKKHRLEELGSSGYRRGDLMATSCGSPCYAAPELVISEGIYTGRKVDVWSCGVILYAMLAGYLPFDDDPANPDGDNINLLYRYISTAPLVFPEHVSPHARDLLRRILVPDPRKRADLFEVARHSWLSDYAHVVEFITSSAALPSDLSKAARSADGQYPSPPLGRSASVRESTKITPAQAVSPIGGLVSKPAKISKTPEADKSSKPTPREAKRRTVQVEYLPPQTQTTRGDNTQSPTIATPTGNAFQDPNVLPIRDSPRPRVANDTSMPLQESSKPPPPPPKNSLPPPTRPPRSISDSNAFTMGQSSQTTRPPTQGSMTTSSRLPSRGSYAQPVAATVATANAQGHFSQPKPTSAGYVISAPVPQSQQAHYDMPNNGPTGRFERQQMSEGGEQVKRRGHTRSHTLTDLGQRLFGRSTSVRRGQEAKPKPDRSYPPTSMKQPMPTEPGPRQSIDSRRSFGFGRKSTEFTNNPKRSSRRFSFIPRFGSSHRDTTPPRTADTTRSYHYQQGLDGSQDTPTSTQYSYGSSRPPPSSFNPPQTTTANDDRAYQGNYSSQTTRAASAGNPTTQQVWPSYSSNHAETFDKPSTATSAPNEPQTYATNPTSSSRNAPAPPPVASYVQREKDNWDDSEQWNANRKWYSNRSSPAQRVMDFFKGRRHERSGMA